MMERLIVVLHVAGAGVKDRLRGAWKEQTREPEAGVSAVEWVIIVASVVVLAGLVYAFMTGFIQDLLNGISFSP